MGSQRLRHNWVTFAFNVANIVHYSVLVLSCIYTSIVGDLSERCFLSPCTDRGFSRPCRRQACIEGSTGWFFCLEFLTLPQLGEPLRGPGLWKNAFLHLYQLLLNYCIWITTLFLAKLNIRRKMIFKNTPHVFIFLTLSTFWGHAVNYKAFFPWLQVQMSCLHYRIVPCKPQIAHISLLCLSSHFLNHLFKSLSKFPLIFASILCIASDLKLMVVFPFKKHNKPKSSSFCILPPPPPVMVRVILGEHLNITAIMELFVC